MWRDLLWEPQSRMYILLVILHWIIHNVEGPLLAIIVNVFCFNPNKLIRQFELDLDWFILVKCSNLYLNVPAAWLCMTHITKNVFEILSFWSCSLILVNRLLKIYIWLCIVNYAVFQNTNPHSAPPPRWTNGWINLTRIINKTLHIIRL